VIKFGVNLFTSSVALVTFHIHLVAVVLCWIRVDLKVCLGNYVLFANMLYSFTKASKHLPQWIAFQYFMFIFNFIMFSIIMCVDLLLGLYDL